MRSASKNPFSSSTNPFASTSQALDRAKERRTARASGRRGLEEDDNDGEAAPRSKSKDRGSEPAAIPSRRANKASSSGKPAFVGSSSKKQPSQQFRSPQPPQSSESKPRSSSSRPAALPPPRSSTPKKSADAGQFRSGASKTALDQLPPSFRTDPRGADPILVYLPRLISSEDHKDDEDSLLDLKSLLQAAQDDVRLHRGRVQAGLKKDPRLIRTYTLDNDPSYIERTERLTERQAHVRELIENAAEVMGQFGSSQTDKTKGKTVAEMAQQHLLEWQKALQVYVHCPAVGEGEQANVFSDWRWKNTLSQLHASRGGDGNKPTRAAMIKLFDEIDEDGSGEIDADELIEAFAKGGRAVHAKQLKIFIRAADTNGDGMIDREEWDAIIAKMERDTDTFAHDLDWSTLFDLLLDGISEDQDISAILAQASAMCQELVQETKQTVYDAAEHVADMEASYRIRLEAHTEFSRHSLSVVGQIEDQFKRSGRAALQIGQQLERAEMKRSQCEAASVLIRRWWTLESLAEQESQSEDRLQVMEEVCGQISPEACQMDPLYTRLENSLEAARALKQLRAVVRSKGNAAATGSANAAVLHDKAAQRRFELTASLIQRTSDALEHRLLQTFETVYIEGGGAYDFSSKPRPGSMDWRELRSLAQALLLFDSGRNLHKRYVDMVVSSRFPELFQKSIKEVSKNTTGDAEFDMDATRSKLSNLFHRVSDVCTAEFELIAHVFGSSAIITPGQHVANNSSSRTDWMDGSEEMSLVVGKALLQRVISDPQNGLQARINDLLASIDRIGDFESGAKKLDTFVVIHEKAAGLFSLLKDAADSMIPKQSEKTAIPSAAQLAARQSVESLKGFLNSQELALSNTHRQGYINLELRLLHHDCCSSLDLAGCTLVKATPRRPDKSMVEKGILEEYKAPILPLHKLSLARSSYTGILSGPLKQSVLRQPLIHATDSLARARLMFGTSKRGGETTARVILSIYNQMCNFYGQGFLYPIVETIKEMLPSRPPAQLPPLPFDEEQEAPDLGVAPAFWVALERVHSASKSFDRELWAENREGSQRVWEILNICGDESSMSVARDFRLAFYTDLERRGEAAILSALDTLSTHIQWVLVSGGESMMATGGTRIFNQLTGQSGGPYAIPAGSSLDTPNSPAIKSLTYCLRVQFVHVQAALTTQSLGSFWTALSMRLYDILVTRLLQHYTVSTVGAVILSRDIEALRSVSMLSGSDHSHWDLLRELVTLYMTPPDAIKSMLLGPEGDANKGLFAKAGKDHALVFLSRRNDYRYKTAAGPKKSSWVGDLLSELNVEDPSDGVINIGSFAAGQLQRM